MSAVVFTPQVNTYYEVHSRFSWSNPQPDIFGEIFRAMGSDFNSLRLLTHVCRTWKRLILSHVVNQEMRVFRILNFTFIRQLSERGIETQNVESNLLRTEISPHVLNNFQEFRNSFLEIREVLLVELRKVNVFDHFVELSSDKMISESLFFGEISHLCKIRERRWDMHAEVEFLLKHNEFEKALSISSKIMNWNDYVLLQKAIFLNMVSKGFTWLAVQHCHESTIAYNQFLLVEAMCATRKLKVDLKDIYSLERYLSVRLKEDKSMLYHSLTLLAAPISVNISISFLEEMRGNPSLQSQTAYDIFKYIKTWSNRLKVIDLIANDTRRADLIEHLLNRDDVPSKVRSELKKRYAVPNPHSFQESLAIEFFAPPCVLQ